MAIFFAEPKTHLLRRRCGQAILAPRLPPHQQFAILPLPVTNFQGLSHAWDE